ncbi:NIP7 pre-PUA domain-containing protein [Methanocaldococcus sp.]
MKIRRINKKEEEEIYKEIYRYCKDYAKEFNYKNLYALKGQWVTVCYSTTKPLVDDVYLIGNVFGDFKRKFRLSLEGFSLIADKIVDNYCIVNEKGETLFLYGRDIFKKSILEIKGSGRLAVFNKNREFLGIGIKEGDIIKNVKDKGWYLREGG